MTNAEFNEVFRKRTKAYAARVLNFIVLVPFNTATKVMTYQLGKSAASVGANFRAFCRGRSKAEKFSKICIVVEEIDECEYWLELMEEINYGDKTEIEHLLKETLEILKVTQKIKSGVSP